MITNKKIAALFKTLAGATRIGIIRTLAKRGEANVDEIAEALKMTHSAVSHQLGLLKKAKVVDYKKAGRKHTYVIVDTEIAALVQKYAAI